MQEIQKFPTPDFYHFYTDASIDKLGSGGLVVVDGSGTEILSKRCDYDNSITDLETVAIQLAP